MLLTAPEQVAQTFIPQVTTKELAISRTAEGERRIRLSSNWLRLYGFEPGVRHDLKPMAGGGLEVVCNPGGRYRVYERRYTTRKNNPLESQFDIQNQSLLNQTVPSYTERLHFEMRHGRVLIRPLPNRTFAIRRSMESYTGRPAAFVAMTSGIDARCLADVGFEIDSLLEYRPQESRDKTDLTETGALAAISNVGPVRLLLNENIMTVDMDRVRDLMSEGPPCALLHMSPQCDDFSAQKSTQKKQEDIDSLQTSADMAFDCLSLVQATSPSFIILENVVGFRDHPIGKMVRVKLQRWGYHVVDGLLDARDFGGKTSRKRYYLLASVWPGIQMPQPQPRRTTPMWSEIEPFLADCRDVTHTKSVAEGIKTGRIRLIRPDSLYAPTITKSQNRQTKDSCYLEVDGRFLLPSNDLLAHLNGIRNFDFSAVAETIESEIVGQSIQVEMHEAIARQALEHIYANTGKRTVVSIARTAESKSDRPAKSRQSAIEQLGLFEGA